MFNRLARIIRSSKTCVNILKPSFLNPPTNSPLPLQRLLCSSSTATKIIDAESRQEKEENNLQSALDSDPALEQRYKILQLEVDNLRHSGKLVPDELKPQHWIQLLKEKTRSARRKYLKFLFTVERKAENMKRKKELAKEEREKLREEELTSESDLSAEYRLHRVSMFMRIYDTTVNRFYHSRLIQAMMFGPKLVLDCGFYDQMTPRECAECAKQLAYTFAQNRMHRDPFDLHFCNINKDSLIMQKFNRIIPTAYEPDFPLNITEKSYTEVFDKNKLVYLTPHCNHEMKEYDPDSIYIIGAIVDKTNSDPLSLARAKKEGLRMAKLPLNKYLLWGAGSGKRLPLNQMVGILTDIRITGDWREAFKHVPQRKLDRPLENLRRDSAPRERNASYDGGFAKIERPSFNFKERSKKAFDK